MYRKNVAGQHVCFGLVNAATGAALTGASVTAFRSIDGAAQASVTGTVTEQGNGQYSLALSQADTNGNNIAYLFTASNAILVNINIITTAADPTDSVRFGLTALPNAAAAAANGLLTSGSGANQLLTSTGLVALTTAERTSIADALLTRAFASVSPQPGATDRNMLQALRFLRNAWITAVTTLTVMKEDDVTTAWTSNLTLNAGASPITGSDPA